MWFGGTFNSKSPKYLFAIPLLHKCLKIGHCSCGVGFLMFVVYCSFPHFHYDFCPFSIHFLCFSMCFLSATGLLCSSMFFRHLHVMPCSTVSLRFLSFSCVFGAFGCWGGVNGAHIDETLLSGLSACKFQVMMKSGPL